MPAWWARPAAGFRPRAAVLVLPEVFGVNGWVRSVAERLAGHGYAALALPIFSRTAPDLDVGYDAAGLTEGRRHRVRPEGRCHGRDGRKGGITQGWVRFGRLYPFYPLIRFQSFFILFVPFLLFCLLFLLFVFVLFGRTVGSHN